MKSLLLVTACLGLVWPVPVLLASGPSLEVDSRPDGFLLRWQTPTAPGQIYRYQLQESSDLESWRPCGVAARSAGSDQPMSQLLPNTRSAAFYRLTLSTDARAFAVATGGAEVFGYNDLFQTALDELGQISPDQFAQRFAPQPGYVSALDWDPTTSDFWSAFNTDPAVYNKGLVPGVDDLRQFDFRLNDAELALFKKNGFVVSECLGANSCGEIYSRVWIDDLPVFVTSDSVLHAWHRSYDMMLAEIERTLLRDNLGQILEGMAAQLDPVASSVPTVFRDSVLDADYFITVALSLLRGTTVPTHFGQDARVAKTLAAIAAEQLDECFPLFGKPRAIDFSQFKPRGHYADAHSFDLQLYFKSMMWLGRIDFRVAGGPFQDAACVETHLADPRELETALILNTLLRQAGEYARWQQSEKTISTFVGWTDSMTFSQLGNLLAEAGITSIADIKEPADLQRLQDLIAAGALGHQAIVGDYFVSPLDSQQAVLPQSFTVLGQKFVLDSWALSQVVADRVLWTENGATNKVPRRVPSALDVAFSVLGNDQIVPELVDRMQSTNLSTFPEKFRDGLNYQHNLAAVRLTVDQQPASAWSQNIYAGWLDSLRQLSTPLQQDQRLPDAMRTRAWALKDLNTQLASWTELRHDTILYAKQSYTETFACSYPRGFVEPRPAFWKRLQRLAENTRDLLLQLDYGSSTNLQASQTDFLQHFAQVTATLAGLSDKEIAQEPFTAAENDFIATSLAGYRSYAGYWTVRDGWYPKLFYHSAYLLPVTTFDQDYGSTRWDPLVTDVHTDLPCEICDDPGGVLHEATSNVNLLLIAINNGTNRCVYAGPVMSHYEFVIEGSPTRLSDFDWQKRLAQAGQADITIIELKPFRGQDWSGIPHSPAWTSSYLVEKQR